ncbi:hypothetical protein BDQ17DRAFT_1424067 [Cyathus striatus]|nr:hypothetical protein BDQ17DRAFT_1424067 [Cyathus striatus]
MSLNDRSLMSETAKSVDVHPGVANPTSASGGRDPVSSNFVQDPTTDEVGAGAGPRFEGHNQAKRVFKESAGVVEGRPGIIESTNIDPLNKNSNKDDGWANTTTRGSGPAGGEGGGVVGAITGAAQFMYGQVMGDEEAKKAGKEAVYGRK